MLLVLLEEGRGHQRGRWWCRWSATHAGQFGRSPLRVCVAAGCLGLYPLGARHMRECVCVGDGGQRRSFLVEYLHQTTEKWGQAQSGFYLNRAACKCAAGGVTCTHRHIGALPPRPPPLGRGGEAQSTPITMHCAVLGSCQGGGTTHIPRSLWPLGVTPQAVGQSSMQSSLTHDGEEQYRPSPGPGATTKGPPQQTHKTASCIAVLGFAQHAAWARRSREEEAYCWQALAGRCPGTQGGGAWAAASAGAMRWDQMGGVAGVTAGADVTERYACGAWAQRSRGEGGIAIPVARVSCYGLANNAAPHVLGCGRYVCMDVVVG